MSEEKTQMELIEEKISKQRNELLAVQGENEKPITEPVLTQQEIELVKEEVIQEVKNDEKISGRITQSEDRLNNAQSELQKTKDRIKQLKEKKKNSEKFQKYINDFVTKMQELDKEENWTKYTLQTKFKSIRDFKDYVRVHLNMQGFKGMQIKSMQGKFVGVLGRFGAGKSFILNRLFELGFPSAEDHTTEGIGFHLLKDLQLTLIDTQGSSEGSQAFVRLNDLDVEIKVLENEKVAVGTGFEYDQDSEEEEDGEDSQISSEDGEDQEKQKIIKQKLSQLYEEREQIKKNIEAIKRDKMNEVNAMSIYVNQLVRKTCGIILYLVEEQNLETEREIKSLAEFCDQENKTLVVVMNYKKLTTQEQIISAIEKDVLKSSYVDTEYSKEEDGEVVVDRYVDKSYQGKPIYRYIIANEDSMAGMLYNRRAYNKIRDLIISSVQKEHFDYLKILNKHHKIWADKLFNFDGPEKEKNYELISNIENESIICPFQKENDSRLTYKDFDEKIEEVTIKQQHINPKHEIIDKGDHILINAVVPQFSKQIDEKTGDERDQFNISVVRPDDKLVKSKITIESKLKKLIPKEMLEFEEIDINGKNKNKIVYSDFKLEIIYDEIHILKQSSMNIKQTVDQGVLQVKIDKWDDRI